MKTTTVHELEVAVLVAVTKLRDDAYGLRVRREVSALLGHEYSIGAVHTTLQRLEDKRCLESWTSDPLPVRGGRARRQYRVTAVGRTALADARRRASRLWAGAAAVRAT